MSLAKGAEDERKDLGPWVRRCMSVDDWESMCDPTVKFSSSLKTYVIDLNCTVVAERGVQLAVNKTWAGKICTTLLLRYLSNKVEEPRQQQHGLHTDDGVQI